MKYLYELHCHTKEVSRCGKISAAEMVEHYHKLRFSGICITDHDVEACSAIDKNLPWEQRIELFEKGYLLAKEKGDELGMDVFFGWEYTYQYNLEGSSGNDFLTYGLGIDWLKEHPEIAHCSLKEYCDAVHKDGGFIVHAHPFREAEYIDMIRLAPRLVDGVEVFNSRRTELENKMALIYAENYGLSKWAASDNHVGAQPLYGAIAFSEKPGSIEEICRLVLEGKGELLEIKGE